MRVNITSEGDMDRKTAERAAAQIVREAKEFTAQRCEGHVSQQESVWFLVGVLKGEIATLLEGRHSAQRENCNAEN